MSDSEKTRKKLVESIRKTKAGQAAGRGAKVEAAPALQSGEGKKAPRKKAAGKRTVAKKGAVASGGRRTSAAAKRATAAEETPRGYIRGRRVWPD